LLTLLSSLFAFEGNCGAVYSGHTVLSVSVTPHIAEGSPPWGVGGASTYRWERLNLLRTSLFTRFRDASLGWLSNLDLFLTLCRGASGTAIYAPKFLAKPSFCVVDWYPVHPRLGRCKRYQSWYPAHLMHL